MAAGSNIARGAALTFEETARPRAIPNPTDNRKNWLLMNVRKVFEAL